MLRRSRDHFQFYGDQHIAKSPPQVEKAARNYALVAEINATLLKMCELPTFVVPPDFDVGDFALGAANIVRSPDNWNFNQPPGEPTT